MMRCEHCGGRAQPGLAHLHGNPCRHLCHPCTERELERQEAERARQLRLQELRGAEARTAVYINQSLPNAA
jgi:hypothetical protein